MKKRQTISVTLATFNEEVSLPACLNSVKGWVDEIIVVDGKSTDSTAKLARSYGAIVLLRENNPVFHVQKKIANEAATSDWVLQLDADERITPEMKIEILDLLDGKFFGYDTWLSPLKAGINKVFKLFPEPQKLTKPAAAYWLPRRNFFLGRYLRHAGQYPDPVIRLFQRGQAQLPAQDVHEQMVVKGVTGWLRSEIDHYATPDFSRYLLRENRYSSLKAQQLKTAGVKITLFNTLKYLFFMPLGTFGSLYLRYRGFLDGFPGFVFSLYSGLHHAFSYMKLWEIYKDKDYAAN
jgi:glycosyltransferase involved in cell wall biosynthesis